MPTPTRSAPALIPSLLTLDDAHLAMDATADRCAILDAHGCVERTNKPWDKSSRAADPIGIASATVGTNYLTACGSAAIAGNRRAGTLHAQLQKILRGEAERIQLDFERALPGGKNERTSATLERVLVLSTHDTDDPEDRVLISFETRGILTAQPTSVPEAGFAVPSGARLERLATALDSLAAHAAILDVRARIVRVNAAWRSFGAACGADEEKTGVGANYLAVCAAAHASGDYRAGAFAEGMRSVLRRDRHTFYADARAGVGGEARKFRGRVTSLDLAEGRFALVTHTEVKAAQPAGSGSNAQSAAA